MEHSLKNDKTNTKVANVTKYGSIIAKYQLGNVERKLEGRTVYETIRHPNDENTQGK